MTESSSTKKAPVEERRPALEQTEIYKKRILTFRWHDCYFEYKNDKLRLVYRNWRCSHSQQTVPLKNIRELRVGRTTDVLLDSKHEGHFRNEDHYSLIQEPRYQKLLGRSIDFRQKNVDKQKLCEIARRIDEVAAARTDKKKCNSIEEFIAKNTSGLNNLSHFQMRNIFSSLKINYSFTTLLNSWNFSRELYIDAFENNCVDYIFYDYSSNGQMTREQLQRFFEQEQYETRTVYECERIIQTLNESWDATSISLKQFRKWFCEDCDSFSLIDPKCLSVWQPMNRPMSEYFIASSHNTYLTGNQITSNSSYEIYRHVLRDNCRCVEIDVWNGAEGPVVCHGNPTITLTTQIDLRKVLEIIHENAFVTSEYPLILSIENHLNKDNQKKMAIWMEEIFGEFLHKEEPHDSDMSFPSPQKLMKKIFVKGSKNKVSEDYPQDRLTTQRQQLATATTLIRQNSFIANIFQRFKDKNKEFGYFEDDTRREEEIEEEEPEVIEVPMPTSPTSPVSPSSPFTPYSLSSGKAPSLKNKEVDPTFSRLITLFQTTKVKGLCDMEDRMFYEMCSFTDSKSSKEGTTDIQMFREITAKNMIRIYPTPSNYKSQLFSANYYPLEHWDYGAQMVALNYQTNQGMIQNAALFQLNGSCGYVLKPDYLRNPSKVPPPTNERVKTLSIRIVGGVFVNALKKNATVNLKVVTRVYFPQKNNIELCDLYKSVPTRAVRNNGFTPVWNEHFEFDLNNPDLSIVQFVLLNNERMIGEYTIAYPAMRTGTRCFTLRDRYKKVMHGAKLFVHVKAYEPRPKKIF